MGRVFTIPFQFQEQPYTAMVTLLKEQSEHQEVEIRFFHPTLKRLVAGSVIHFATTDRWLPANIKNPQAVELFLTVRRAINEHLQPTTADELKNNEDRRDSTTTQQP